MLDRKAKQRPPLVLQSNRTTFLAIREGDWKLVETAKGPQLYNLAADLVEDHDLANAEPARVKSLAAKLATERARTQ